MMKMVPDHERFTEGDCWFLMKRIHRLTQWPCCSFAEPWESSDYCATIKGDDGKWVQCALHGFVQRPDKLYLDVEGLHTEQEMWDKYVSEFPGLYSGIQQFPLAEFRFAEPEFGKHTYKRAQIVADKLLDKYGAPWYIR